MDWIATGLTIVGSYLLSKQHRKGWVFLGIASVVWIAYGTWTVGSIPIVILNAILIINAIRGFRTWGTGPR